MWLLIYESTVVMLCASHIRSAAHLTAGSMGTHCILPICATEPRGMGDPWWVDTAPVLARRGSGEDDCLSISKLLFASLCLALCEEAPEAGCCPCCAVIGRKSCYFRSGCLTSFNMQAQIQTDLSYADISYLIFKYVQILFPWVELFLQSSPFTQRSTQ